MSQGINLPRQRRRPRAIRAKGVSRKDPGKSDKESEEEEKEVTGGVGTTPIYVHTVVQQDTNRGKKEGGDQ